MAARTTTWKFADVTERDSFGTAQGVGLGDVAFVQSTNQWYEFDGSTWVALSTPPHASTHSAGSTDPINVEDLATTSTDTTLVFAPDGSGGVQLRQETAEAQTWSDVLSLDNTTSGNDPTLTEGDDLVVSSLAPGGGIDLRGYFTGRSATAPGSVTGALVDVGAVFYDSGAGSDTAMVLVRVKGVIAKKPATGAFDPVPFIIEQAWNAGSSSLIATFRLEGAAGFSSTVEKFIEIYSPAAGQLRLRFKPSSDTNDNFYVVANIEVTACVGPAA